MMKQLLMRRLNLAMKSSKEAEIVRANAMKDDAQLAEYESIALETVKRVSAAKSALSDRLLVKGIFENAAIPGNSPVASIVLKLVERIQSKYSDDVNLSHEAFVEGLLTEGSSMTAVSCLDDGGGFTLDHFRQVASLVHRACKTLADMYSHVHVGKCARRLAKRWLVHGDDVSGRQDPSDVKKMTHHSREVNPNCTFAANKSSEQAVVMLESFSLEEEDDTANFVMDLNAIATNQDVWSDDIVSSENVPGRVENITADEEPSAIKYPGSARETSEYNNARVAIRIAFVISFADGYHQHKMKSGSGDKENNSHLNENDNSQSKSRFKKLRLSNSEGSQQGDSATEHARELLEIVFAKSGGSNWVNSRSTFAGAAESTAISTKSPLGRSFSANVSTLKKVSKNGSSSDRKTITFAMRHRALRTASILCPQEVLDMIIKEEGYFNVTEDAASRCTVLGSGSSSSIGSSFHILSSNTTVVVNGNRKVVPNAEKSGSSNDDDDKIDFIEEQERDNEEETISESSSTTTATTTEIATTKDDDEKQLSLSPKDRENRRIHRVVVDTVSRFGGFVKESLKEDAQVVFL